MSVCTTGVDLLNGPAATATIPRLASAFPSLFNAGAAREAREAPHMQGFP
jgi:hypothetical protein